MERLTYCGGPFQTNAYLIECGEQSVLFDAPQDVANWVKSNDRSVDLLILTHLHIDHILGVEELVNTFNCPVWAHSAPSEELTLLQSLARMTGSNWQLGEFAIEKLLTEEPIKIEDQEFQVLHIPGHSPDSLCFYHSNQGYVIGGDVLFQNGIGRTDFPHSDHNDLITGIKSKLWELPDETEVLPGHGPPTTIGFEKSTNPFIR